MAGDLTTVTELATALGMLGYPTIEEALAARSPVMVNLTSHDWDHLDRLRAAGQHATAFAGGFENGQAFLVAPDALRGRPPALIEWKGSHRAPGDDAVPADLRIDHVYLVSCKYLSRNLHNRSPSRVFDRLLGGGETDPTDWYRRIAPLEHQALYEASVAATALDDLPGVVDDLQADQRARLRAGLPTRSWPTAVQPAYAEMCQEVSTRTAQYWNERLPTLGAQEAMLWRLLRITHAPYFILGSDPRHPLRLRIHTPWDWRQGLPAPTIPGHRGAGRAAASGLGG